MAVLTVSDDGPGIPAEKREQVFERFFRIDGTEGDGSGLGLAIVREVAENTGGRVALSDNAANGAANGTTGGLLVEVRLPLARDEQGRG
jgi:two-component system sensor histidine kinase TctE